MNTDVFTFGYQVLFRLTNLWRNDNFPFTLGILAVGNTAVDFRDYGIIFRLTCFEQLCYAWQTTGNILGFGCFARNFSDNITSAYDSVILNRDIGAYRQEIPAYGAGTLAAGILYGNPRAFVTILGLYDNLARQTGYLIQLFFHAYTFDDVAEFDLTGKFSEYRHGVGVPLCKSCSRLNLATRCDLDFCTIHYTIFLALAPGVINYRYLTVAIHNDVVSFCVYNRVQIYEFYSTIGTGLQRCLLSMTGGGTTNMEGTHGQLCTRLTN